MAFPTPQLGLVLSYAYLWHHEHRAGLEEGRKDRPCVIVLAVTREDDQTMVTVVPITHQPPADPSQAIELPPPVKRHLGLDAERSWVMLHEGNEFAWPGFDLRPIAGGKRRYDYGFLPPRLFRQIVMRLQELWAADPARTISRD